MTPDPLAGYQGFEWDDNKRRLNVLKHQLDVLDAIDVFADPHAVWFRSPRPGNEQRFVIVGRIRANTISVVFTRRGQLIRLISARASRRNERQMYDSEKDQRSD